MAGGRFLPPQRVAVRRRPRGAARPAAGRTAPPDRGPHVSGHIRSSV